MNPTTLHISKLVATDFLAMSGDVTWSGNMPLPLMIETAFENLAR